MSVAKKLEFKLNWFEHRGKPAYQIAQEYFDKWYAEIFADASDKELTDLFNVGDVVTIGGYGLMKVVQVKPSVVFEKVIKADIKPASLDEILGAQSIISRLQNQLAKCKEQRDYYAKLSGASDQVGDELELEAIR